MAIVTVRDADYRPAHPGSSVMYWFWSKPHCLGTGMKVEQPDSTGATIESAQASGELACPLDGTSMQAHHIATRLGVEPFPRAGNVMEGATIENSLIENDVCHRTVAGASVGPQFQGHFLHLKNKATCGCSGGIDDNQPLVS